MRKASSPGGVDDGSKKSIVEPMYEAYFGLKENPFNLSPDPRYLYLSRQHREAIDYLVYGIGERKGFVVVTGGIGTGKTTICRSFLAGLDPSVESALIFNSCVTDMELLETVNKEFGVPMNGLERTKKRYVDALNDFLLRNFSAGKNAVLLIDEAQNLSHGVMEQIRMLSNLETVKEKLLQIVLIGQPELQNLLTLPSLQQLNERITVRYHLGHLERNDISDYIEHRLGVAGGSGRLNFSRWTCKTIYGYSGGNPRRINAICDRALLIAYTRNTAAVTGKIVRAAVRDIGRSYFTGVRVKRRGRWLFYFCMILFVVLVTASGVYRGEILRVLQGLLS